MKDEALERVWKSRDIISRRCGYDTHKLVKYYQSLHKKSEEQLKESSLFSVTQK